MSNMMGDDYTYQPLTERFLWATVDAWDGGNQFASSQTRRLQAGHLGCLALSLATSVVPARL